MDKRRAPSARKELRALIERALAKEADIPEAAARRVVNRILRRSDRIAEIGIALKDSMPAAKPAKAVGSAPVTSNEDAFDPYAFGAVVTLQRYGREALSERLAAIARTEDLVRLAAAQNLALAGDWSNAAELRTAIIESAAQRLAERFAAAS